MAAINQRLGLFWTSNSAQVRGDLGRVGGSFLNLGQQMNQMGRQSGLVNSQMKALGTTLKYLVSGTLVYGTMNMVRNLAQFQEQLGLIAAIGGTSGFVKTGRDLDQFTQSLYGISSATIEPLNETADALTNFFSSVQAVGGNLKKEEVPEAIITIGRAAKLSQTPVEDMTKGILAMNQAFGRPQTLHNIKQLAGQWYELISAVPGGRAAAPQLINQLGQIAGGARLAAVSPGQALTLSAAALRFGIPPAQVGAGVAYLLRSIAQPETSSTVKSAREQFASLGITNEFVQKQGGWAALMKIFDAAKKAGVKGNLGLAGKRAFATRDDPNLDPNLISDLGLSGAGINVLGNIFRRQHALRTAIAIYVMLQQGTLNKDLTLLGDSVQSFQDQQKDFARGWRDFAKQAKLQKAAIDLHNLGLQVTKTFEPIFNLAAQGASYVAGVARHHPTATKIVSAATAGLLTAIGANSIFKRMTGRSLLGRFGNLLGGGLGQAALVAKAAEDQAANMGNVTPGLTPGRPLYVMDVGWLAMGYGRNTGPGDPGLPIPPVITKVGKDAAKIGRIPWFLGMPIKSALFRGTGAALVGWGLAEIQKHLIPGDWRPFGSAPKPPSHMFNLGKLSFDPKRKFWLERTDDGLMKFAGGETNLTKEEQWVAKKLGTTFQNVQRLEKIAQMPNLQKILKENNHALVTAINDTAGGGITIDLTIQEEGKTKAVKKVHIDPSSFSGGKTPGSRGKKKVMKKTTVRRRFEP